MTDRMSQQQSDRISLFERFEQNRAQIQVSNERTRRIAVIVDVTHVESILHCSGKQATARMHADFLARRRRHANVAALIGDFLNEPVVVLCSEIPSPWPKGK